MLKGNKLLLALLLPVFVLAFCLAAFALDESDFIIIDGDHFTPEEWAAKQDYMANNKALKTDVEQPLVAAAPRDGMNPNDPALKTSPKIQNAVDKAGPATNLLFEDFESGVIPPTGWTADVTNAGFTWQSATSSPYNGTYYTNCEYDPALVPQDEWLISPVVDLTTGGSSWVLEFHWYMSYYWGVDPYDNYDLEVWISTDGGANFNTMLWDESQAGEFTNWTWYEVTIDLTSYLTETNVAFGFRYVGSDGAEGAFDYISVNDDPLPSGRCCFGDPAGPSCADETQGDCTSRPDFLSWDEGLDCTNNPCPIAGNGDDCTNPIVATFPADFVSDQYLNTNYTCGRGDAYNGTTCMGYYDGGEDIIYEFTVTEDIFVDITLDPKGTTYTGFAVSTDCPPTNCLINTSSSSGSPYGVTSAVVPAGTYYVMVDTWPSPDCISDFDLTIDYLGAPPAAPANDNCADAEPIAGPFPQTVTGTTINSTVDCPGLLDWQAVWYSFENPYSCGNVTIDYCGTSPELVTVGVILMDDCACDDYILHSNTTWDECPADGNPTSYWNGLSAGTYYYPAFTGPGTYGGQTQDFQFTLDIQECPPAPANDECSGAEVIALGTPTSGTTVGATIDCPAIFDEWYGVWYQFTLSSTTNCNDVSVSYCGSSGASPSTVSATLIAENSEPDCCDEASMYYFTSGAFDCPNGWPQLTFEDIPDGTYYYIVAFGADPYDFVVEINAIECPPAQPGDNCSDPLKVTVNSSADLPYVDNNYTCGRGNNESNTCMSYYDGGEDIFYEINVNTSFNAIFTLDPQGTSYSGMALGASCPPPGSSYSDCLAEVTSSSGSAKSFSIELTPGTYYLMIDTWPAPDCIPSFTLTIEELIPEPGDNCSDPLKVNLPSDAPYMDIGQTTCGRIDDYSSTCLSYYDGGEDILYEINIDEDGYYEFIHDPKGTSWTGMGLSADCPPSGSSYSDCIAEATDYSSSPHGFVVFLEPGTYYLMIDTWPSPDCIPDFDLTITYLEPPTLEYDQTLIEFCQVGVDESGCTTLNLGNSGDVEMDFEIMIDYGDPLPKEIDGANITTTDGFTPGATADVLFTISNASSDAEWIDEFTMTFPAGVTVNGADDIAASSGTLVYDGSTGDGATATWTCDDPPYGCMYSSDVETFNVNLTFDGGLAGSIVIDYTISGDEWGSPPHDVSGSLTMTEDNPLYNWLSVDVDEGTVPGGGNQAIQVCYNSTGLTGPGVFQASVVLYHNGGLSPITIPVTMTMGDDHEPAAMILIDRSGSMALEDASGDSRLLRAKNLAHSDADDLLGQGYMVAVMAMNESFGMTMMQDFSTDPTEVHDAIDAIVDPRHDTPLAAAMCESHCYLADLGCGTDALYTYTDGLENCSLEFTMCYMCDYCYRYYDTGWNFDCDPSNPATCTDWQLCLAEVFSMNALTTVNYFGTPINPFVKGSSAPEDMYFLKYTAEASDGEFFYYGDAAFVAGDANGDGSLNVSDAVFIINYVFIAGDAPNPIEAGDANCDDAVNVSDAVYLINHVFIGGPAPVDCGE